LDGIAIQTLDQSEAWTDQARFLVGGTIMALYDMASKIERDLLDRQDRKGDLFNRDRIRREVAAASHGQRGAARSTFLSFACALPLARRSRACSEPGS
jgi:hypothetical protein